MNLALWAVSSAIFGGMALRPLAAVAVVSDGMGGLVAVLMVP